MAKDLTLAKLSVDINARLDKLDQQMNRAEDRVDRSAKAMKQSIDRQNIFEGITGAAARFLALMGAIELAAKTTTAALKAIRESDSFVEGAGNFFKTLEDAPTIGPAVRAIRELSDELDGTAAMNAEAAETMRGFNDAMREQKRLADQAATAQAFLNKTMGELTRQGELTGLSGTELQLKRIEQQAEQRANLIRRISRQAVESGDVETASRARTALQRIKQAADREKQVVIDTAREAAREKARVEAEEAQRAAMDRLNKIKNLQSRIRAEELSQAGKDAQAQAEVIRESFRQQIADAAGDPRTQRLLRRLRDLQIAGIGKDDATQRVQEFGSEVDITSTAFGRTNVGGVDVEREQLNVQKDMANNLNKIARDVPRIGVAATWQ